MKNGFFEADAELQAQHNILYFLFFLQDAKSENTNDNMGSFSLAPVRSAQMVIHGFSTCKNVLN